jgi:hypothetical protein
MVTIGLTPTALVPPTWVPGGALLPVRGVG